MAEIVRLSSEELLGCAKELAAVLVDTVASGASVGFTGSIDLDEATAWWEGLAPDVADGALAVWAARSGDRVVGTVQLRQGRMPTHRHRAEVAKLMVERAARGIGVGRALLATAEAAAADAGSTLLVLDTETGSAAERLYAATGWTRVGTIPDFAADPAGVLRPTTYYYKSLA
ncbi:GNAT family N-acetyltransferase [Nocardiopsis rhodophaea]|uniref:GNAT family N-acetyltransferase n=1 Tax=Nocardiopsis rhodophaea TaxID=280238 RepID=UPI0031DAA9E0